MTYSKVNSNLIIYIMMLGTFGILSTEMGMIGILPQVAEFLKVNISQAGLFVSLFALIIAISGAFMPLVCSKFDRKKMFVLVLSVFTIFTFLSALITDFYLALIVRGFQHFSIQFIVVWLSLPPPRLFRSLKPRVL